MSTRTVRDNVAAASFAFIASALVCGAVLVATMTASRAQTLVYPSSGNTDGAPTVSQGTATGNPHTDANWTKDSQNWSNANTQNSATAKGIPGQSTTPTLSTTTMGVKK